MTNTTTASVASALRAFLFLCVLTLMWPIGVQAQTLSGALSQKSAHADRLSAALAQDGHVRVIIRHQTTAPIHAAGGVLSADTALRADVAQAVDVAQRDLLSTHRGGDADKAKRWATRQISHFPLMAMTVNASELQRLSADSRVVEIWEDKLSAPSLDQSVPLIGMTGASGAYVQGADGAGTAVAILDTGVQSSHPFLAGKVVDEACFSTTNATYASTTMCPNGLSSQTGTGAGVNCDLSISSGCAHGTHVAGIAAGKNASGAPSNGVAKEAKIIAVQVFSKFTGAATCGTGVATCVLTYDSDQIAGMNYVLSKVGALSQTIASVNMSLGGGQYFSACDTASQKSAIDALKAANVATVIAAGNNGFTSSISSPGCISTAIAVGATNKSDVVASYSNVSSLIKVFAPGSAITSSVAVSSYSAYNGTSMATPHVAGAFAALRSAVASATVDQITNALVSTGTPITDTTRSNGSAGGGITKPRIRVDLAAAALIAGSGTKSVLTAPANGSTLTGAAQTFTWSTGTNVTQYWLQIGTALGGNNVYNQSTGTSLSLAVGGLPTAGQTVYVRHWSLIAGAWLYNDYTFTAFTGPPPSKAVMSSPAPASTLGGTTVPFNWSAGSGATQYWLYVGTTVGGTDLYNQSTGSSLSASVSALPNDGRAVYVRLWTQIGSWQYNDYTYSAVNFALNKAVLTSPANASVLSGTSTAFAWTAGTGVAQYWLQVGSSAGAFELYDLSTGTSTTATVTGLPLDSRPLYVRLWSQISGVWLFNDYTMTASPPITGTKAVLTSPAPGATLTSTTATLAWSAGTNVSEYWLAVGNTLGSTEFFYASTGTNQSITVSGLPADQRTLFVRLWSKIGATWSSNDYTLTAVDGRAVMLTPATGAGLGATQTFTWSAGAGASEYWIGIGSAAGTGDIYSATTGLNQSFTRCCFAQNGQTVYVRLWSKIGTTWLYNDTTYINR